MFLQYVSIRSAAGALFAPFALVLLLSTASADSNAPGVEGSPAAASSVQTRAEMQGRARTPRVANEDTPSRRHGKDGSCVVMDRPKHTIRQCRCDPSALSSVGSIDAAEMIRLLIGNSSCRSTTEPSR
jgi:hypothetical protein